MPMSRLRNGQPFPALEVPAVGGGTISLPEDLAGSYGVVLIYRGSWCPYCNAQLAAFSRALDALTGLGVKVVAPTGAYVNDDPHYLQSTGFVLAPDGRVRVAVYSSDAIGRLVADDVAGYIRYLTEHAA